MAAELPTELAQEWRRIEPYSELVDRLLPLHLRQLVPAWALLLAELEQAALDLSEAHLAQIKLAWWQEELGLAAHGKGRHPITRTLFDSLPAIRLASEQWVALAAGAQRLSADDRAVSNVEAQLRRYQAFTLPAASLEVALFGSGDAEQTTRAHAIHLALDQALMARRRTRQPWPLDLVARSGSSPASDSGDAAKQNGFFHAFQEELIGFLTPSPRHALYRGVAGVARTRLLRSLPEAVQGKATGMKPGLRTTFALWSTIRKGLATRGPT